MGGLRQGVAVACVLAVAVGATGCSSSDDGDEAADGGPLHFEVGPDTDDRLEVADGLVLTVEPGDFAGEGTVDVSESDVVEPEIAGYEAFGAPVDLDVSGGVESDLTLEMTAEVPEAAFGMVLRFDEEAGWYPIAVADDAGVVVVDRESFSPLSWGWARIEDLSDAVAGVVRGLLGKRHDPPQCPDPSPDWFEVDPPGVDVVTVCATSNADPGGGPTRGEVRVVNNRGVVLEVQVPSDAAYAFVDGQPDPVRAAARGFTGRDSVLLVPGQLMTVGFTQPEVGSFTPLRVDYTAPATIASMLLELIGSADGYAAVYAALAECGVAPEPLDVRLAPSGLQDVITGAINCFKDLASDPAGSATLAVEAIAAIHGIDPAVAAGDRAFAPKVDALAGNLRKAARALAVVSIASDLIDAASDLYLNTDLGDFNSLSPGVSRAKVVVATRLLPPAECTDAAVERYADRLWNRWFDSSDLPESAAYLLYSGYRARPGRLVLYGYDRTSEVMAFGFFPEPFDGDYFGADVLAGPKGVIHVVEYHEPPEGQPYEPPDEGPLEPYLARGGTEMDLWDGTSGRIAIQCR